MDDPIEKYEKLFIQEVIKLLENETENFTAINNVTNTLNDYIKNADKNISIFKNGDIWNPIKPDMSSKEKKTIQKLCKPIFDRDIKILLEKQFNIK